MNPDGGSRIAAQGNKKYLFRRGEKASVATQQVISPDRTKELTFSTSSFFPNLSDDEEEEAGFGIRALRSDSVYCRNATTSATPSQRVDLTEGNFVLDSAPEIELEENHKGSIFRQVAVKSSVEASANCILGRDDVVEANKVDAVSPAVIDLTNGSTKSGPAAERSYIFTQDPIPVAGEGEDDYEDVEWESGLSADESDIVVIAESQAAAASSARGNIYSAYNALVDTSTRDSLELPPAQPSVKAHVHQDISIDHSDALHSPPPQTVVDSSERSALEHAVATASLMNDWAGREMQKFLKSRMKVAMESSAAIEKSPSLAERSGLCDFFLC